MNFESELVQYAILVIKSATYRYDKKESFDKVVHFFIIKRDVFTIT